MPPWVRRSLYAARGRYRGGGDFEEKGERAIGEDPDRIWRIKNARVPPGEVKEPEWFGYPDLCGDGLPVWHELYRPNRGNLDAMGAFAIAEQLGLALAHHELRDLAFDVEAEKSTDQLILMELMLEMAAVSILYGERV